jgi:hypothetical protein
MTDETEFRRTAAEAIYLRGVLTARLALDADTATAKTVDEAVSTLLAQNRRMRAAIDKAIAINAVAAKLERAKRVWALLDDQARGLRAGLSDKEGPSA